MSFILAMCTFALTMSITPGPVNIITLSSGTNHGVLRTLPFVTGATVGFTALLFLLGLGVVELFLQYPTLMKAMGYVGTAFILYMAVKIMMSKGAIETVNAQRPHFWQGAMLQWLNPKAWIACMSGLAAFTTKDDAGSLVVFCLVYFALCYVGVGFWAVLGAQAKQLLRTDKQLRFFNIAMGACLFGVAVYLITA